MRCKALVLVVLLLHGLSVSGDAPPPEIWQDMAGMGEETEAEKLELRDELLAAHVAYMSSLELALTEISEMRPGDPQRPLGWSRAEYLLETSFRLIDSTGEIEAFLKATEHMKPVLPLPISAVDVTEATPETNGDDGLIYLGPNGQLNKAVEHGRFVLREPGSEKPVVYDEVIAIPREPERPEGDANIELIRARAAWLRALALERLGRTVEAAEETRGLGVIRDWLVLGALESDSETVSDNIYGLEELYESLSENNVYPGKTGPVSWKPFTSADPMGRVFPEAMFRSEGLKSAYLLALVHSQENREAVLRFGSNSPATVCVNLIQRRRERFTGMPDPDQEAFGVWLRKGWNVVLIRTSSTTDGWGLAVRLTARDGAPFPGYVAIPTAGNLPYILAKAREAARRSELEQYYHPPQVADLGGLTVLSKWLADHEDDARANFYLASFLVAKRLMEGPERFDREIIFRRALELSGNDPFFSLMAARSVDSGVEGPDREENLRLVLLQQAADKGSAAALVDIGRLYLDVMRQPRRADEYAELAQAINPMSLRAGVLDYDVAVAMDWHPVAKELLKNLVQRHPTAGATRLRLGRSALAEGRHRQALTEFHAILGVDAANAEALDGAVRALGMLGQTSAAVDLLVGHIERFPYDYAARIKLAELYRAIGRDSEALVVLDDALAMAPDDAVALSMRMDIDRESYAEGRAVPLQLEKPRRPPQDLDFSPPKTQPPEGWEYLYFQTEDRIAKNGSIDRTVSFALRIHSDRAARLLRHLGFWLEPDYEQGVVTRLDLVLPNGQREPVSPPDPSRGGTSIKFNLPPLRVGLVVEAEVEIKRARIPFLGDYFGQIAPLSQQAPVRLSRYLFTSPKEWQLYFKPANGAPEAMMVETGDGDITRIWEMNGVPAFMAEPDSPGQHRIMPCVQISSFGDWNEFARWYWRLISGQYHTPPELRALAERLGEGETLPLAKLDRAAHWVARNIGNREWAYGPYAFRPINARSILSRLSADSKDRTLFLCLLAREYGLTAWPVLTRMRNRRFPASGDDDLSLPLLDHFNHSIALIESWLGGDVYLDASNPHRPPGVMPSRLAGTTGVAVTEESADMVVVPDNGIEACHWQETAEMVVDPDGSVLWEQSIRGVGTAAEALRRRFHDPDSRLDAWSAFLESQGGTPSAVADEFHNDPDAPSAAQFVGRTRLRQYASTEEDRVILTVPELPGTISSTTGKPSFPLSLEDLAVVGIREYDLLLPFGFRVSRRITVDYPEDWRLVNEAVPFQRTYAFGTMTLEAETRPGGIDFTFTVEVPGHRVAAADFSDFREMAAVASRWLRPVLVWEIP